MKNKRLVTKIALFFISCGSLAVADPVTGNSSEQETKAFQSMFGQGPQEEDVYKADRLLVTATGSQKPVHLAPSVASIITAEDIKEIGATTLNEALETVPGMHIEPAGNALFASNWSIRGLQANILNPQVLFLINGVPFSSNYQGGRYFSYQMPVAMISRIEVVRGPGSALHGADAFSGVVNVITKDNFEIDGSRGGIRYGSFDTIDTWVQHGGQYGGWDMAFSMEWQKTGGDDDRIVEKDYLHAINQAAKSNAPGPLDTNSELLESHLNLRKQDFNLHIYSTMTEAGIGPGGAQALTYGNDIDANSLLADLKYHNDHQFNNWTMEGRAYYSLQKFDNFIEFLPASAAPPQGMFGNPIGDMEDGGLEASAIFKGLRNHQLRVGTGFKNYDFEPDQYKNFGPVAGPPTDWYDNMVHVTDPASLYMPSTNRHLWYGLAQDQWQFARSWELTAGVRYDEYSDFGSTVNPRAALVWETLYNLTTKLMYGSAFRAPSFSELYVTKNPQVEGNPSLAPEEITTYELAFDYQPTKNLRMMLNLFTYNAKELIELIDKKYQNNGEQEGHGFEVEMNWHLIESLRLRSNFAYQRSQNAQHDAVVADAPTMQLYLNPSWTFLPDWSMDGQFTWIADRHRAQGDPRASINDYELVNIVLRKKNIAKNWEAALSVKNLFNEDARTSSPYVTTPPLPPAGWGAYIPNDYPMEGRALWAEVSCHF